MSSNTMCEKDKSVRTDSACWQTWPEAAETYSRFTPEEYMKASENATCGLCMRMWSDYCYQAKVSKIRFAPRVR